MTITLNPQLEKFINEQVNAGRFASPAEALEAGVARLMLDPEPDTLDAQDLKNIGESLKEMARGDVIDAKELHAQIRLRYPKK